MSISLSDLTAIVALAVSIYATIRTLKYKKNESELIDLQKQVNFLMLERGRRETQKAESADLTASFITIGSDKHRLRVTNIGPANAYGVHFDSTDDRNMLHRREIREKFPLEVMVPGQSVDILAIVSNQSPRKITVKLLWKDDDGKSRSKVVYPTM